MPGPESPPLLVTAHADHPQQLEPTPHMHCSKELSQSNDHVGAVSVEHKPKPVAHDGVGSLYSINALDCVYTCKMCIPLLAADSSQRRMPTNASAPVLLPGVHAVRYKQPCRHRLGPLPTPYTSDRSGSFWHADNTFFHLCRLYMHSAWQMCLCACNPTIQPALHAAWPPT